MYVKCHRFAGFCFSNVIICGSNSKRKLSAFHPIIRTKTCNLNRPTMALENYHGYFSITIFFFEKNWTNRQ